jgi:hypothetical protein
MFRRKKKSRVEQVRADLEKQIRVVNKQAFETRKDLIKRLNRTAQDLRVEVEQLLDGEEQKRANNVAAELERVASKIEKQAEAGITQVRSTATQNVWTTLLVAFAVGMIIGLFIRNLDD